MFSPFKRFTGLCFMLLVMLCPQARGSGVSLALLDIGERLYTEQGGTGVFSDATVYEPALVSALYAGSRANEILTCRGGGIRSIVLIGVAPLPVDSLCELPG